MAQRLKEQGYPSPEFDATRPDRFRLVFRKQFTQEMVKDLGLNRRQLAAMQQVMKEDSLTNQQYQEMFKISKRTATRELSELVEKKLLARHGTTGKGTYYTLF